MQSNKQIAVRYLEALGTHRSTADLDEFMAPDMVFTEYPNRIAEHGSVRDLATIKASWEKAAKLMQSQRFEVLFAYEQGDTVVLEALWEGVLAVPLGTLKPGESMRAHSAMFLEFASGKIRRQRNYDCFPPFSAGA